MLFKDRPSAESLFALSPSETVPLWLELTRRQVERRTTVDLLSQYARDGFVQPSMLDLRAVNQLDALALRAAHEFEALLLSPVAPLGTCSVLAPTSQDRTLSAVRGTEVVSDPTNVLALECATRCAREPGQDVRLCSVHQVVRAQPLPPNAGFSRHFRLFVLAEAGVARAEDGFEVDAVARHVAVFDRLFSACEAEGAHFPERRATLYASERRKVMSTRISARLKQALPHVEVIEQTFQSNYYDGLRILFGARALSGDFIPIGDTGLFDWVQRLRSNRRLRFVASGLGLQLVPLLFRARAASASTK